MPNIFFKPLQEKHIPFWMTWSQKPHVAEVWFIEGYETRDYLFQKIKGNGYDFPFIIYLDNDKPIGYIQCSDLWAYRTLCPTPQGVFTAEDKGTFCMDLFIGEETYLNKGYGTLIVQAFCEKLFVEMNAKQILIDPAASNKRAIRCYEKAGFQFLKVAHDGVTDCYVMKKEKS